MSAPLSDDHRYVIPRWRDVRTTVALGELLPVRSSEPRGPPRDFLTEKIRAWKLNRIWPLAGEVIGAALVLNRPDDAREAAEFILGNVANVPLQVGENAARILGLNKQSISRNRIDREAIVASIKSAKVITRAEPRDAFAWVEMSRNYAILGQTDQALRAMNIALTLAPNHRYVVRSAVRLYTHIGEHSRAHHIVRVAEATVYDPWMLSTEIATAALAGKSSRHTKAAHTLLESSRFTALDKSELASALGTLDSNSGDLRRARRLFRVSLEHPTDNAIAQARWADSHKIIDLDPRVFRMRQAYEARAWYAFYSGAWELGLQAGRRWLRDQPFSASPAVHTSYIAAVALEDYERAVEVLQVGRTANPRDANILNNLSYSLACMGRLGEAASTLELINRDALSPALEVTVLATSGLISYREGDALTGRLLYHEAIEKAQGESNRRLAAKAALFLAREELRAGGDAVTSTVERALALSSAFKDADFDMLRSKLEKAFEQFTPARQASP